VLDVGQELVAERARLADRLVHLPVRRDQRPAVGHQPLLPSSSASTPRRGLTSVHSSEAPPPVESQSTSSSRPNCASAAPESPPPTIVVAEVLATASAT